MSGFKQPPIIMTGGTPKCEIFKMPATNKCHLKQKGFLFGAVGQPSPTKKGIQEFLKSQHNFYFPSGTTDDSYYPNSKRNKTKSTTKTDSS